MENRRATVSCFLARIAASGKKPFVNPLSQEVGSLFARVEHYGIEVSSATFSAFSHATNEAGLARSRARRSRSCASRSAESGLPSSAMRYRTRPAGISTTYSVHAFYRCVPSAPRRGSRTAICVPERRLLERPLSSQYRPERIVQRKRTIQTW